MTDRDPLADYLDAILNDEAWASSGQEAADHIRNVLGYQQMQPLRGYMVMLKAANRFDPQATDYAAAGGLHRNLSEMPARVEQAKATIAAYPDIYRTGAEVVIGEVREAT